MQPRREASMAKAERGPSASRPPDRPLEVPKDTPDGDEGPRGTLDSLSHAPMTPC